MKIGDYVVVLDGTQLKNNPIYKNYIGKVGILIAIDNIGISNYGWNYKVKLSKGLKVFAMEELRLANPAEIILFGGNNNDQKNIKQSDESYRQ